MDDDRKAPTSLRDYLRGTLDIGRVFWWTWEELTTPDSKRWMRRMLITLGVLNVFQALQPLALGYVFTALTERDGRLCVIAIVAVIICLIAQRIADRLRSKAREWVFGLHHQALDRRLNELFFAKSVGQHIQHGSRLTAASVDKGRWRVLELQGIICFDALPTIVVTLISLGALSLIEPLVGGVMAIVVTLYLIWGLYLNYQALKVCTPIEADNSALNRRRTERWDNIERVKICAKEEQETSEMRETFGDIIRRDRDFWMYYIGATNWRGYLNITGIALALSWGAWQVWSGQLAIGLLYPLINWTMRITDNVWQLADVELKVNEQIPSVRYMIETLAIDPDIVVGPEATRLNLSSPPRIEFVRVSHTFPSDRVIEAADETADVAALKDVSFVIEPGEKVALLGPSGAGKSTIMKKLLRYSDPTSGRILVGGHDLREINLADWMGAIGYIAQQPQVFDGTIRYNLTYGLPPDRQASITDDELIELMALLEIDFARPEVGGVNRLVGRNGLKLSGGQAQRLMIAAAAIKRPKFMVIDEATSSLDSTTERKVQAGLAQVLSADVGALIVAHRLSTVRDLCSKFIVLRQARDVHNGHGQVEAIGRSFEGLYELSPTFRQLADDQQIRMGRSARPVLTSVS